MQIYLKQGSGVKNTETLDNLLRNKTHGRIQTTDLGCPLLWGKNYSNEVD